MADRQELVADGPSGGVELTALGAPPRWYTAQSGPSWRLPTHQPTEGDHSAGADLLFSVEDLSVGGVYCAEEDFADGGTTKVSEAEGTGWDAAIAAAARRVFLDRSLMRPGPRLLPFGHKTRITRQTRKQIDDEAAKRRQELQELLRARHDSAETTAAGACRRWAPTFQRLTLAAGLVTVVVAVSGISLLTSSRNGPAEQAFVSDSISIVDGITASQPDANRIPAVVPEPLESALTATGEAVSPADRPGLTAPDLLTPTAAAWSWMVRWCPLSYAETGSELADAVRDTMTDAGWAQFIAERAELGAVTQAADFRTARQTLQCNDIRAAVSLQAPRTADAVVVVVTAVRTVSSPELGSFEEPVTRQQQVLRGPDGRWRVDITATGA